MLCMVLVGVTLPLSSPSGTVGTAKAPNYSQINNGYISSIFDTFQYVNLVHVALVLTDYDSPILGRYCIPLLTILKDSA